MNGESGLESGAQPGVQRLRGRRPRASVWLPAIVVLGLIGSFASGCDSAPWSAADGESSGTPTTAGGGDFAVSDAAEASPSAAERGIVRLVTADGALRLPEAPQTLVFPAAGDVEEVRVEVGDLVSEGDVLARMDTRPLMMAIVSAEADVAAARSTLVRAQTGTEVERARLEVERAKNSLWAQQAQRDATCGRVGSSPFGAQQVDCDAAQANVQAAEQAVQIAERSAEAVEAARGPEIAAAKARLDQAQASLVKARVEEERAVLTAPFHGAITEVAVAAGASVGPGVPAITIARTRPLRFVTTNLSERNVGDIRTGLTAEVVLNAFPEHPLQARVARIAATGTPDEAGAIVYPVYLDVEDDGMPLRAGMTGRVEITIDEPASALPPGQGRTNGGSKPGTPAPRRPIEPQDAVPSISGEPQHG